MLKIFKFFRNSTFWQKNILFCLGGGESDKFPPAPQVNKHVCKGVYQLLILSLKSGLLGFWGFLAGFWFGGRRVWVEHDFYSVFTHNLPL